VLNAHRSEALHRNPPGVVRWSAERASREA
jgi:hypothetical protein